jgi:hypothetical protein
MKTFIATFCAVIAAMAIGFGFWKHEKWVEAKNQCISAINNAYQLGLNADGGLNSRIETMEGAERVAAVAAENLLALFRAKILPLSGSDRKDQAIALKIVAKADFKREWRDIFDKVYSASSKEECDQGIHELTALCDKYGELANNARKSIPVIAENCALFVQTTSKPADKSEATQRSRFVTLTQPVSIGGNMLPVSTQLEFLSRDRVEVGIRYEGAVYMIPISVTDLK